MSQERLEVCTETVSRAFQALAAGLEGLESSSQRINDAQLTAELRIRGVLEEVKIGLKTIRDHQKSLTESERTSEMELLRRQQDLQGYI